MQVAIEKRLVLRVLWNVRADVRILNVCEDIGSPAGECPKGTDNAEYGALHAAQRAGERRLTAADRSDSEGKAAVKRPTPPACWA